MVQNALPPLTVEISVRSQGKNMINVCISGGVNVMICRCVMFLASVLLQR
jgi:hypothetical protein